MDSCHIVFKNEIVMERIFEELSLIELVRAQEVCTLWKRASENVLKRRNREMPLDIFTDAMDTRFMSNEDDHFYEEEFFAWKKRWKTVPDSALIFMSRIDSDVVGEVQSEMFPLNCRVFVIDDVREAGFVTTDTKLAYLEDYDMESALLAGVCSIISFPNLAERVAIEFMTIATGADTQRKSETFSNLKTKLSKPDLKVMMIFATKSDFVREALDTDLKSAVSRGVVVFGGFFDNSDDAKLLFRDCEHTSTVAQDFVAVSIAGKHIKAVSICMDFGFSSIRDIDTWFNQLKDAVGNLCVGCEDHFRKCNKTGFCCSCKSQMVGFMATDNTSYEAFCSRLSSYEAFFLRKETDEDVVDREIIQQEFRNFFPNIPLFGGFFDRELGESINLHKPRSENAEHNVFKSGVTVFSVVYIGGL